MEEIIFFWQVALPDLQILENEVEEQQENAIPRFLYSRRYEAFNLSDRQFHKNYRLSKVLTLEIIELLRPHLLVPKRASDISVEVKVLTALNFFANGSYQEPAGKHICHTISQPSVSRCIQQVTSALNRPEILNHYVHFPETEDELAAFRLRFFNKYNFPGIIGIVDGTHVAIKRPDENEEIYLNRKTYHSINVQLVCDENMRILSVNAKFPGSCHDSHVWRQSDVSQTMQDIHRYVEQPYFLIGDSGYPLRPWILIPYQQVEPGTPDERFQHCFTSIRSTIERCNGKLKNMWRALLKHRVLHYTPEKAGLLTNACVVLHNIAIDNNIPEPNIEEVANYDFGMYLPDDQPDALHANVVNNDLAAGRRLRQAIANNHFA